MKGMKGFLKRFRYGEKGFTLVELLVVVAILGILAAVAIPNVGNLIGKGHESAQSMELQNVRTATIALIADSDAGELDDDYTATDDMATIKADSGNLTLNSYMTGLDGGKTECTYTFTKEGVVDVGSCE